MGERRGEKGDESSEASRKDGLKQSNKLSELRIPVDYVNL